MEVAVGAMDGRWHQAIQEYISTRLPQVEAGVEDPDLLGRFRAFCGIWIDRYNWDDPNRRRFYEKLSVQERRETYERFERESRGWDASFKIFSNQNEGAPDSEGAPSSLPSDDFLPTTAELEQEARRRRIRELDEKEVRTSDFFDHLEKQAAAFTDTLRLPWKIKAAFEALGLPAGAPLAKVRQSYRRLARLHHPDQQGDHDVMAELNAAYRSILDHYQVR